MPEASLLGIQMSVSARSREGKGMHSPEWGKRVGHIVPSHPGAAPPEDEGCKTSSLNSVALQIVQTKGMHFSSHHLFYFGPKSKPRTKHGKLWCKFHIPFLRRIPVREKVLRKPGETDGQRAPLLYLFGRSQQLNSSPSYHTVLLPQSLVG